MSTEPDIRSQAELLEVLYSGSPTEQQEAIARLAIVGDAEALDALVEYLRSSPAEDGKVALETLRILANKYLPLDRYGLSEALANFLEQPDLNQRLAATRLLNTHPNELATDALRWVVEESLGQVYNDSSNAFAPRRSLNERILSEGIMALANCGRLGVLPEILNYLEDPYLRPVATRALGIIGTETERDSLEELAEDNDARVRDAAQWALSLMDERIEQFLNPPEDMPDMPPDRLSPVYWAHRQLEASEDDLVQLLVVRMGIEHLLLDTFLSENRVPDQCKIVLRQYIGTMPPRYEDNDAPVHGLWQYSWRNLSLTHLPTPNEPLRPPRMPRLGAVPLPDWAPTITISQPASLASQGHGVVSFDCVFSPQFGGGWRYLVAWRQQEWTFTRLEQTWSS